MAKVPDYIKQNDDGSVDVTLATPAVLGGVKMTSLRMREPTVDDAEASDISTGSDTKKAKIMIANLCEQSPEDVGKLSIRNFTRLNEAFALFTQ